MKKENQIKIIGIASIVWGFLLIIMFLGIMTIWTAISNIKIDEPLWIIGLIVGLSYIVLYIIAGNFLLKHKNWARILLIILSIINLFNFPIGTAVGIWFLVILFKEDVKELMN